jgi:two-component system repressor protein LuxO
MESELFGHVKGAFTGATSMREGIAAAADGGTLFLDEICEMDLDLQKKMLRFVQTGEFQKVGSSVVERVDVRYVCATNRVPFDEVKAGRFREDLYYRLYVVPIVMPPLRDRDTDILAIAEYLLESFVLKEGKEFVEFSTNAKEQILKYEWPGNVRELQNVIQQAVVLNQGSILRTAMLSLSNFVTNTSTVALITPSEPAKGIGAMDSLESIEPLWVVEKRTIEKAIEECGGNVNKAAGLLEVAPSTIYRKLQSWETKKPITGATS